MSHLSKNKKKRKKWCQGPPNTHTKWPFVWQTNQHHISEIKEGNQNDNAHALRISYRINTTYIILGTTGIKPFWGICGFIKVLDNFNSYLAIF